MSRKTQTERDLQRYLDRNYPDAVMDTCTGYVPGFPTYIDVSPWSDYIARLPKTPPRCEWCGTEAGDDKFHPGTCENCGGPR